MLETGAIRGIPGKLHVSSGMARMSDRSSGLVARIAGRIALGGASVLDVGCGDGALVGALLEAGADPRGVDPEVLQLDRAAAEIRPRLQPAGAEALPFASTSFDAVVFVNSLHHVPGPLLDEAFAEAKRVLRPGGDLLVIEPLAAGPWFELLLALEDETEVRAVAQEAIGRASGGGWLRVATEGWTTSREAASAGEVAVQFVAADRGRQGRLEAAMPELRRRFDALGEATSIGRRFAQPMRLDHLRRPSGVQPGS
jgi:SAM-dependent methyltransferase